MEPVSFKGANVVLGANQEQYADLPAFIDPNDKNGQVITCHELTDEEIVTLVRTRRIYHSQMTFKRGYNPTFITTELDEVITFPDEKNNGG